MFARRCRGCMSSFIGLEDAAYALFLCNPSGVRYAPLNAIWMRDLWVSSRVGVGVGVGVGVVSCLGRGALKEVTVK
jgi:hypothetical protein